MSKTKVSIGLAIFITILVVMEKIADDLLTGLVKLFHLERIVYLDFYTIIVAIAFLTISFLLFRNSISKKFDVKLFLQIYLAGILSAVGIVWILQVFLS